MKNEWRDLFDLSPVLLYKADLFDLEKMLCTVEDGVSSKFCIQLTNKNQNIEVSSVKELFDYSGLPSQTDKISIVVHNWKTEGSGARNIVGGVSLTLHHNYVSCQIHSCNEEWFIGKKEKIKRFFVAKKPWYSVITRCAPFLLPMLILIPFQNAAFSLGKKEYSSAILSFALIVFFLTFGYLSFKMVLFPYVKVFLKEKNKKAIDWNFICTILMTFSAVLVIIDYIFKWLILTK